MENIIKLDFNDSSAVTDALSEISDKNNFETEIYTNDGRIVYTTHGSQMMDFFIMDRNDFSMSHEDLIPYKREKLKNGIIFEQAKRRFDKGEVFLCKKDLGNGLIAEIRVQKRLITSSAATASEFIAIVSFICFFMSVIWIFIFAKKFSKPLSNMNEVAKDIANQKFDRKLDESRHDEIGQLSISINEMSQSLCNALSSLKKSNEILKNEIETERQLDVMRKGFVANVSHELKTPISIISGYAEGLKLDINSKSRKEYCDTIIEESNRMNKLVLSILELSKYESGQIPVNKEHFDISVLTDRMLKSIFANTDINTQNLIPNDCVVYADEMLIEQVLKAYLENAVSHTFSGGTVTASCEKKENKIRVFITNTGKQIEREMMPQIWQSFFRGDSSHKREQSRFGLGLSIVEAIMKLHNCDCGVYNTSDGVCFWFDSFI